MTLSRHDATARAASGAAPSSLRLARRAAFALGIAALAAPAAVAQTIPDSTRRDTSRLESVVVRSAAAPATIGGASAVVVAVDSLRLAPSALFDEAIAR